jgi:DNA (cytosine-5)-methyltransferase 1
MDFISLFSGIGGLDLGFERAGMTCVAQVEKDPFCQKVLQKHWAHVPKFGDIRDVGKHNLPSADVIVGGFPCQPHSKAGKRRGKADDRNLWGEYLRIIDEIKPRIVVGENVPGIITTMLDEILSDLESRHYTCQAFIIPACAFDAPHRRDRVFIIAKNSHRNGSQVGEFEKPISERNIWNTGAGNEQWVYFQSNNPNSNSQRSLQGQFEKHANKSWKYAQRNTSTVRRDVANPSGARLQRHEQQGTSSETARASRSTTERAWNENWFEVATRLCRVDDGIPNRVDRLKSLGNSVVPQVAEYVGRSILQAENAPNTAWSGLVEGIGILPAVVINLQGSAPA